jgi:hypothetical protein
MDKVNSPKHYNIFSIEVIDMMIRIWGVDAVITFCELNSFKYRMRAGAKENAIEDLNKASWYENKINELKSLRDG